MLHGRQHLQTRPYLGGGNAIGDRRFERREVIADLPRELAALRGRVDDERPPIVRADFARDEPARREPIENARQRRALVREPAVQVGDGRGRRGGQVREDVRLALRQIVQAALGDVQADSMRGAMDRGDELHRGIADRVRPTDAARRR